MYMEFTCTPGQDPSALVRALNRYGAVATATPAPGMPDAAAIYVLLPSDEYREKICRELVAEWQRTPSHWEPS